MSSIINKRKHAPLICTLCMDKGDRGILKTQYHRSQGKFVPSGIYQCNICLRIAVTNQLYPAYRKTGLHIIWNLENLQESINE